MNNSEIYTDKLEWWYAHTNVNTWEPLTTETIEMH